MPRCVGDPITLAREASAELQRWAADVDQSNRFPHESVERLRSAGLLALMVPTGLDGGRGSYRLLSQVAAILGDACLSTAIIWAMHSQQVLTLVDHGGPNLAGAVETVARDGCLIASATAERDGGGRLFSVQSPLVRQGDQLRLERSAPTVSYAAAARYFLVTMRAAPDAPLNDVRLVLVDRQDGGIQIEGSWNALGMRGTQTVPVRFDLTLDPSRVVAEPFRSLAIRTFIPAGHVGWAAAWYGAASGALRRFVRWLRTRGSQRAARLDSDLLLSRIADLRARLDPVGALLDRMANRLDEYRDNRVPIERLAEPTHQIELNNLKIVASEVTFGVVDELVQLAGLREGYLANRELGLERVFRDLRSASLMFGNERLRQANGRLMLLEPTPAILIGGAT